MHAQTGTGSARRRSIVKAPKILNEGRWIHDFGISIQEARRRPVSVNMPRQVYELMDLHPQAGTGRPSVLCIPTQTREPVERIARTPKKAG